MVRRLMGAAVLALCSCYSAGGNGSSPPPDKFYLPTGLAVSRGGNVLYAVNSDFDLQWNGGTLQSYNLWKIRRDIGVVLNYAPTDPTVLPQLPYKVQPRTFCRPDGSYEDVDRYDRNGRLIPIGQTCAPPMLSEAYIQDSATIGAFSTELQLSNGLTVDNKSRRLFVPLRSNASLTWADVPEDDPKGAPPDVPPFDTNFAPFRIDCGDRVGGRCDARHSVGNNPNNEPGNTRKFTMPGEPFGLAQSEDGATVVVTHQALNDARTSLFLTGLPPVGSSPCSIKKGPTDDFQTKTFGDPSLQYVVDNVTPGGNGITVIPHDPDAFLPGPDGKPDCTRQVPAFLATSRFYGNIDRYRVRDDDGGVNGRSQNYRPWLQNEVFTKVPVNASNQDVRGITIDATDRIACKAQGLDPLKCARLPARIFVATRSPASIVPGTIGGSPTSTGYDPDELTFAPAKPLSVGASRVYLAPIVDREGNYSMRLFVVCYDSATIYIFDPRNLDLVPQIIHVGAGPFALAFDPFDIKDVALRNKVLDDERQNRDHHIKRYSFAYVASFIHSFVQVIDLDNSRPDNSTFGTVVYTLGQPTDPKGAQ